MAVAGVWEAGEGDVEDPREEGGCGHAGGEARRADEEVDGKLRASRVRRDVRHLKSQCQTK